MVNSLFLPIDWYASFRAAIPRASVVVALTVYLFLRKQHLRRNVSGFNDALELYSTSESRRSTDVSFVDSDLTRNLTTSMASVSTTDLKEDASSSDGSFFLNNFESASRVVHEQHPTADLRHGHDR